MSEKKVIVRKKDKEYEVSADGEGNVWLDNDEEVVSNPDNLRVHAPRADGKSHIKSNALSVAAGVVLIVILIFLFA